MATYSKRAALDSEIENRTPNKKSRFITKDKELKTPVEISQRAKNAKSIVRNLDKNKALSPSPQKRSPLKSPKKNISVPDTPNSNSSVNLSDTDTPKNKSVKQAQLKKTQSKLDSFIQIKKDVRNDNESTNNTDAEKEKRKQNRIGRQDKRLLSR